MKKILLPLFILGSLALEAETVNLGGTDYDCQRLIDREIGPGIRHMRFRLPSYPLNINVLEVDLNNPYNTIETTVANETSRGTEGLVHAAERQSSPGHVAVGGANANFWIVASQPEENVYKGITRNASVRNGVIVTESNQHRDQWDGGTMRTGVVSLSTDKTAYVDYCTSTIKVYGPGMMPGREIHQVNKGIHPDELAMYNSFYGANTAFLPICQDTSGKYQHDAGGDATEVILDFCEGSSWSSNTDITFVVREVRPNAGKGTLGNHDAALVGRGDNAPILAALVVGDILTINYSWTYNPGSDNAVTPQVNQAVGPNALVMRGGELTAHNENENYNSMVYSRTGYGCSADGKTVYIIVIDKSTDPVYGASKGCNTATMCEFARMLGCTHMANFDAGGSAEMFVNGRIENRTTEGNPRAVANGWLIYDIAPDAPDASTVARLEFDAPMLEAPIYGSFSPKIIAYNRYGSVIDYDYRDFTLSVSDGAGRCDGNMFYAGGTPCSATLTATANGVSVSKTIDIRNAELSLRVKNLLIDATREYRLEVVSTIGETTYEYDPSLLTWTVENPEVATIDANGVLHGVAEGTTTYTCAIGDFTDQATVTVQVAPAPEIGIENWAGWTSRGASGMSDVRLTDAGSLTFKYSAPRDPYVTISRQVDFYSIPDAIVLEFRSSVGLRNVTADLRTPAHTRANNAVATNGGANFDANTDYVIELPIDQAGDPDDLATYPLSLRSLRFNIVVDNANRGNHTIELGRLYARYDNYNSGVENVASDASDAVRIAPNPIAAGTTVCVSAPAIERVEIFNAGGMAVATVIGAGTDRLSFPAPGVAGVYIVRVSTPAGISSSIMIVK